MTDIDPENNVPGKELAVGAPVRVARLHDLVAVRAELGRLYREARRREGRFPDALTAQRLSNVLGALRTSLEVVEIRDRLDQLEASMARENRR